MIETELFISKANEANACKRRMRLNMTRWEKWSTWNCEKKMTISQSGICIMVTVFANGLGSIPGRVIPKTEKMVLDPSCLIRNIIRYASRVMWSRPRKWVVPSPTLWCSSYWKGTLRWQSPSLLYFLHKLETVLENETQKIPWHFEIHLEITIIKK